MGNIDKQAAKGAVEGYLGRSKSIFNESLLDIAEQKIVDLRSDKGFSFPTNEGMRKITKRPEIEKLDKDPSLSKLREIIRTTIDGVQNLKKGGLYVGVNAFHHGHLAYLSKSEAILAVDMNELVPYGFAFIVGLTAGAKDPESFKKQVSLLTTSPEKLRDFFEDTELGRTALVQSDADEAQFARKRLLTGLLSTLEEFNPKIHGQRKIPPVFCNDTDAYNYFRTLIVQDKVAGGIAKLQGKKLLGAIASAMDSFELALPQLNTLYVSSCFDPRFAGPKSRLKFLDDLRMKGFDNIQIVESFLNSGWIIYDVE
ncbi:MAG: hypothetical protein HY226_04860 [Candidatus Vogelbacteria bacterium]|nr:hypothetical protein [Candidatus Vogelbacteria bacterium]